MVFWEFFSPNPTVPCNAPTYHLQRSLTPFVSSLRAWIPSPKALTWPPGNQRPFPGLSLPKLALQEGLHTHPLSWDWAGPGGAGHWVASGRGSSVHCPKDKVVDAPCWPGITCGIPAGLWPHLDGLEALTYCPCQKRLQNGLLKGKRFQTDGFQTSL